MRKSVFTLLLAFCCLSAFGQKADLRRGNRAFRKGDYARADIFYRKGLMQDSSSVAAKYNLANTLYRQGNFDEAGKFLDGAAQGAAEERFAPDYYFNRGDVAIAKEDWQAAVEAFEQCLLRTPDDLQAKENYIYARNKLDEQQGGGGGDNQNQDQDQNQDKDQNQDQDQNENEQQQEPDEGDGREEPQEQPQEQPQLSPQQAQQLLQAIREKEKQTQEKVDEKKAAALKSRQKDKNW